MLIVNSHFGVVAFRKSMSLTVRISTGATMGGSTVIVWEPATLMPDRTRRKGRIQRLAMEKLPHPAFIVILQE